MLRAFDKTVQTELVNQGYSHVICAGVVDHDTEDFLLIPIMPDDPRLSYEESDLRIEPIRSHDVTDMAGGDEFISFYVDLPQH